MSVYGFVYGCLYGVCMSVYGCLYGMRLSAPVAYSDL